MIKNKIALVYDFDNTLSPKNSIEYGLMDMMGQEINCFFDKANSFGKNNNADGILTYLYYVYKECKEKGIKLNKKFFIEYGKNIELFKGVEDWFDRINKYGKDYNIEVEHYIISSGIGSILEGSKIAKYFKKIYASEYIYDENEEIIWPALSVNYTNKTQYLYRINKGILDVTDDRVNDNMPHEDRPIPFENIIYIGDSYTDIPSMRNVIKNGGHSIAVYSDNGIKKSQVLALLNNNKVNFALEADYTEGSELDQVTKQLIIEISKHI